MFVAQEAPVSPEARGHAGCCSPSHRLLQPTGTSKGHLVQKHPKRGACGAFSAHTSPAGAAAPPSPGARASFSLTQPLQAFTPCRLGFEVCGVSCPSPFPPQKRPRSSEAPRRSRLSPQLCKAPLAAQGAGGGDRGHRDLSLHQTSGTALLWPSFPAKGRTRPVFIALAKGILELTVPGDDV